MKLRQKRPPGYEMRDTGYGMSPKCGIRIGDTGYRVRIATQIQDTETGYRCRVQSAPHMPLAWVGEKQDTDAEFSIQIWSQTHLYTGF